MTFGELKAHAARHDVPDDAELLVWCPAGDEQRIARMGQVVFERAERSAPVTAVVFSPSARLVP